MQADDWARLSPLLDELLELDEDARHLRLVRLRMESPELADEVEKLLRIEADQPGFMAQPVVHEVAMTPVEGDHLGPYRLVRLIGEGGMGQVWEAVRADGLYERRVALKLLRPGFADPKLRSRFTRERVILARLAHAYIARLLDAGVTTDGQPYLALEYIQGEPITDYARRLKLPLAERLRLYLQVCEAVSHAHANLVVHRDLKPGNILVTPAGDVRLLDFGIAKLLDEPAKEGTAELTRAGARAFTLHYAAPEQIRGEPVTTMTDVYSLGVVLYELLTGRKPYLLRRGSDAEWENAILEGEPIRPSLAVLRQDDTAAPASDRRLARALSGDLDNIVLKALRKPVEQRYASVEALSQDLRRHMEGRPVSARAPSFGYRLGKYLSRHVVAISVLTGVLTVLGLAVLGMSWQYRQALAEAERAQALQDFVASLFEQGGASGADRRIDVRTLLDSGVRRAEIAAAAAVLPNVVMLPYQPRSAVPHIYASADVGLVPLMAGTARTTLPSKLYTIMAAGLPALVAVDPDSDIVRAVTGAECGVAISPDDADALEAAIRRAYRERDRFREMGAAGRRYVEAHYARAVIARRYHALFEELLER